MLKCLIDLFVVCVLFQERRGYTADITISSKLVARVTGLPHQVDPSYMNYTSFTVGRQDKARCDVSLLFGPARGPRTDSMTPMLKMVNSMLKFKHIKM